MRNISASLKRVLREHFPLAHKTLNRFRKFLSNYLPRIYYRKMTKKVGGAKIVSKEGGFLIEYIRNNFFTFHLRPKKSSDINSISTYECLNGEFCVVIQGPIGDLADFLIETILLYKKIFKDAITVVSTWDGEDKKVIDTIRSMGAIVLQSGYPKSNGINNINLQILSTHTALDYANSLGVRFCLKTRTDSRVYRNNLFPYLSGLLEVFPVRGSSNARARIVASSVATCKYRVYGLTDILLFGTTSDMLLYFSPQSYEDGLIKYGFDVPTIIQDDTPVISEIFLCARYLINIGVPINWSLNDWWESLKNYFCVIDADSLDFFWYKYDWQYEKRFYRSYASKSHRSIEFSDWLALYAGFDMGWENTGYKEKWGIHNGSLVQYDVF